MPPGALHWLGQPRYVEAGRAVVIDGLCTDAGCCGVMATIGVDDDIVTWTDLHIGQLPARDGLRFAFDRQQYQDAIGAVERQPVVTWEFVDEYSDE